MCRTMYKVNRTTPEHRPQPIRLTSRSLRCEQVELRHGEAAVMEHLSRKHGVQVKSPKPPYMMGISTAWRVSSRDLP